MKWAVLALLLVAGCTTCMKRPGYDEFMRECLAHQFYDRCAHNARMLGVVECK